MNGTPIFINGTIVYVTIDQNGYVTTITIPAIKDQFGNPQTVTFTPAVTISVVTDLVAILLGLV